MNNFFDFIIFFRKTFLRKLFSQNVFWIDYGSGKHKKKFLKVERGRERKNFDKKVNSLTRYKIGGIRRRRTFFFVHFFFANPIPSSARPSASLRSNHVRTNLALSAVLNTG